MSWIPFAVRKLVMVLLPVYAAWVAVAPQVVKWFPQLRESDVQKVAVILVGVVVSLDTWAEIACVGRQRHASACQAVMRHLVRRVLEAYVRDAGRLAPQAKVRANIMQRHWLGSLRITHHHNMTQHRDVAISFRPGEGCCGRAYKERAAFVADYTTHEGEPYNLTPRQNKLVAPDRKWFMCSAILSEDATRVVAVLNLDSDTPLAAADDESSRGRLAELAVRYARELLPLLDPKEASA